MRPFAAMMAAHLLFAATGDARPPRAAKIALRKRIHVQPLIAAPGSMDIDVGALYSWSTAAFGLPAAVRYTPSGRHLIWGRTEYSATFDALSDTIANGRRAARFGESITLAAHFLVRDAERLSIAVAPLATVFLREERGVRLGVDAVARYDYGRNNMGATLNWSAATHSSDSNPAATLDAGLGFGRRLGRNGVLGKCSAHGNVVWEKSTGVRPLVAVYEGLEYQRNPRLALDLSFQHFGLAGGGPDHQVVFGITLTLGAPAGVRK
jgi:hypothetical protein